VDSPGVSSFLGIEVVDAELGHGLSEGLFSESVSEVVSSGGVVFHLEVSRREEGDVD